MLPRCAIVLILLGALLSLAPLGYGSPPDPGWIGGFWDDGDYDDVVVAVASATGLDESYPPPSVAPVTAVDMVLAPIDEPGWPTPPGSSSPTRAPPPSP